MTDVPIGLRETGYVFADDDATGGARWRELIRVLHQYYRRDMRDAREQRELHYPKTHKQHIQKTVPLIYRISRELATLYVRPPSREYLGDGLTPAVQERIASLVESAQLNKTMRVAHEQMVAMCNATIWVWPVPGTRTVRLLVPPPHDQEVQMRDPMSVDEADVACWWLRLPVGHDANTGLATYAIAKVTADTAVWTDGPPELKGKGVWMEDGSNPIGMIPVIRLKGSEPAPGEFWCPVPEDLLDAQRGINHMMTDLALVARMQGHGQAVVKGLPGAAAAEMELGPESIIGLPDMEGDFSYVQANPDLAGYQGVLDHYLRAVVSTNGLNPATVIKSSAITAIAKQMEVIDREVERKRQVVEFERAERDLYALMREWVNWMNGAEIIPDAKVIVRYHDTQMPADPLHHAQATRMMMDLGLTSPLREYAKMEGVTVEEARDTVNAIKLENAETPQSGSSGSTLNGAQILAALEIANRVSMGTLSLDGGVAFMVQGLGMTPEAAEQALAGAQPIPGEGPALVEATA